MINNNFNSKIKAIQSQRKSHQKNQQIQYKIM